MVYYFIMARYIEILSNDPVTLAFIYIKEKCVNCKKILPASLANCFKLKLSFKKCQHSCPQIKYWLNYGMKYCKPHKFISFTGLHPPPSPPLGKARI